MELKVNTYTENAYRFPTDINRLIEDLVQYGFTLNNNDLMFSNSIVCTFSDLDFVVVKKYPDEITIAIKNEIGTSSSTNTLIKLDLDEDIISINS